MTEKSKGKVGIMTFHWAPNYGAVLQAWALQRFIAGEGYKAEIINYVPSNLKNTLYRCFVTKHISTMKIRLKEYKKEQLIKEFRKKHFKCSDIEYTSKNQLKKNPPQYDFYISGSDQIWNPYFTMRGQKGVTLSYFLDFVPNGRRRISFSSSFGCKSLPENVGQTILPELKKYYSLSTREMEGVEILKNLGLEAVSTADPTLLLQASDYEELIQNNHKKSEMLYVYMLHGQRGYAEELITHVKNKEKLQICDDDELSVEDWLKHIHEASFVITNSFHCTVFCLLFHIPFLVVDVQGIDMSSRITTLLGRIGLDDRFLRLPISASDLKYLEISDVAWDKVDGRINDVRQTAKEYLRTALNSGNRIDAVPKSMCSGCGLCSVVCPQQCIEMQEDNQGYIYPRIDEKKCVHCGICFKECIAINNVQPEKREEKAYACWSLNDTVRNESSSGGVFTALSEAMIQKGGSVYGARYVAPLQVSHCAVNSLNDLGFIRGSKYQPSNAYSVFPEIKEAIRNGEDVLFVGTPCQVAALKRYAGDSNHLVCADLACHGVPSMRVLRDKCNEFGRGKVAWIDYRNKRTGWRDYSCVYYDELNHEIANEVASESDFMRGYLANLFIRESCEDCIFASIPRVGDISLADCWEKSLDGSDTDNKGISAVLLNSDKGAALFKEAEAKLHVENVGIEYVLKGTPTLAKGSQPSDKKTEFWNLYEHKGYAKTMRKLFGVVIIKRKILRKLKK